MVTLAVHLGQVALAIVVVVGLTVVATWLLHWRRRDVWQQLAMARGLTFSDRSDGPRIRGAIQGRTVEAITEDASSDRDIGGVEVLRMSVILQGFPAGLTAEGVPGLIGDLAVLTEDRIDFEPEEFNRDVLVQGDEDVARNYWTGPRRDAFLELVRTAPCDQVSIRDGRLTAELREVVSDRQRLEHLLDQLLDAARVLDQIVPHRERDQ